jgi:hypothetical protein
MIATRDKRFLSSLRRPEWFWGPTSLLFTGFWGTVSLGLKQLCEKLHSPPITAEVKCTITIEVLPVLKHHALEYVVDWR